MPKLSLKYWILTLLALFASNLVLASTDVQTVRAWLAPDNTRLVFDLSGPVKHRLFTLSDPDRIVIDIENATFRASLDNLGLEKSPVQNIRYSQNNGAVRVVLDLKESVRPKSFDLKPNDQYGHRLVVDLEPRQVAEVPSRVVTPNLAPNQVRDIVIAIDPGHGGEDPGAIGPRGLREKDVVLAIGRELKRLIDAEPGYRAVMIRDGDYYVSLRDRTALARRSNADLFVSVHADGWHSPSARGASVWVLSERGASSEMGRWLASRENSADLIGGVGSVSLEDKDDVLASVLLDMSMTASRTDSRQVASQIHGNISQFARMHKKEVEMAGFAVLRSPDIPSILVETGFITNPQEADLLKTPAYQARMAQAIFSGITAHFWQKPPDRTWIAQRKYEGGSQGGPSRTYRVSRGDTLSLIAAQNGVSLSALREANQISGDRIRVGQVLRIPAS
ncbi:N-acetylmuramoyl-L-alanine amidase [Nitrincola alkalilacustris]|uniref:N-acetylmuramoyl-L-alanine amidase n=1 Tax=Nitrincola alkalilacustris TaxID=1571224 RepID=UPI00124D68E2|nr:N-acetylmuramoyl-L-alanine amidase [Nitrincola alkalilacustris]